LTSQEKVISKITAKYFCKELVFTNLKFKAGKGTNELCDILALSDYCFAIQAKEKDGSKKAPTV